MTSGTNQRRRAVPASNSGRPLMVLLDLLGRRWALRVLWELRDARATFRALQERCDVSPTVLTKRLKNCGKRASSSIWTVRAMASPNRGARSVRNW